MSRANRLPRATLPRFAQLSFRQALLDLAPDVTGFRTPLTGRQVCASLSLLVLSIRRGLMKAWPVLTLIAFVAWPPAAPALRRPAQL